MQWNVQQERLASPKFNTIMIFASSKQGFGTILNAIKVLSCVPAAMTMIAKRLGPSIFIYFTF